jgi:hypothetical protein
MKAIDNPTEKDGNLYHVEDVIDKPELNALKLTRTDFFEAQNDTLSEGRSPWPVIKENLKLCMVVLAVQVRKNQFHSLYQTLFNHNRDYRPMALFSALSTLSSELLSVFKPFAGLWVPMMRALEVTQWQQAHYRFGPVCLVSCMLIAAKVSSRGFAVHLTQTSRQFSGQLFAGWFADRYGRSKCIYLMIFSTYIGVMTEILSQNKNDYTGAKILMGVATGMMQVAIPTYVAEITPREIRGITIGLFSFNCELAPAFRSV